MKVLFLLAINLCFFIQLVQAREISQAEQDYALRKTIQAEYFLVRLKDSENIVEYVDLIRENHLIQKHTIELYLSNRSDAFLEAAWKEFSKKPFNFSIPPQGKTARDRISFLASSTYQESLESKIRQRVSKYGFDRFIDMGIYEISPMKEDLIGKRYSAAAVVLSHYRLLFQLVINKDKPDRKN
jgi:hypothetical protein